MPPLYRASPGGHAPLFEKHWFKGMCLRFPSVRLLQSSLALILAPEVDLGKCLPFLILSGAGDQTEVGSCKANALALDLGEFLEN